MIDKRTKWVFAPEAYFVNLRKYCFLVIVPILKSAVNGFRKSLNCYLNAGD